MKVVGLATMVGVSVAALAACSASSDIGSTSSEVNQGDVIDCSAAGEGHTTGTQCGDDWCVAGRSCFGFSVAAAACAALDSFDAEITFLPCFKALTEIGAATGLMSPGNTGKIDAVSCANAVIGVLNFSGGQAHGLVTDGCIVAPHGPEIPATKKHPYPRLDRDPRVHGLATPSCSFFSWDATPAKSCRPDAPYQWMSNIASSDPRVVDAFAHANMHVVTFDDYAADKKTMTKDAICRVRHYAGSSSDFTTGGANYDLQVGKLKKFGQDTIDGRLVEDWRCVVALDVGNDHESKQPTDDLRLSVPGVPPVGVYGTRMPNGEGSYRRAPVFDVLLADPAKVTFVPATPGTIPYNAIWAGFDDGGAINPDDVNTARDLYVCRVETPAPGEKQIGKLLGNECVFPYGGKAIHVKSGYDILVDTSQPSTAPARAFAKPTSCGMVKPNEGLRVNESVSACNGPYELRLGDDGNLVVYRHEQGKSTPVWASNTAKSNANAALMQADGNFVVYNDAGPRFDTKTSGHPGVSLSVQDDGVLVVYGPLVPPQAAPPVLWASNLRQ